MTEDELKQVEPGQVLEFGDGHFYTVIEVIGTFGNHFRVRLDTETSGDTYCTELDAPSASLYVPPKVDPPKTPPKGKTE